MSLATGPAPASAAADVWGDGRLTCRQQVWDLVIGLLVAALGAAAQWQFSPWSTAAAVLLGLALAVRRRHLPLMVVLALAASVLQVVSTDLAAVPDVTYIPLFFTLGAHRQRLVRWFGLACVVVAALVAGLWAALVQDKTPGLDPAIYRGGALAAVTVVFTGGGWGAGYLRWQRRQAVQSRVDAELSAAEQRRISALFEQEQERGRIAADVHDLAAHSWAVVAALADGARYRFGTDPDEARRALATIGDTARSAMADVRVLLAQLRGSGSGAEVLGFEDLDVLADRLRVSGMDLRLERHGRPPESSLLFMMARRVLAEALTNALKHGDLARPVDVVEDWRGGYRLRVVNAVRPHEPSRGGGHGMLGMSERMAVVEGTVTASRDGDKWVVEVSVTGS